MLKGRQKGFSHSEKTKRKIRNALIGIKRSKLTIKKLSIALKGNKNWLHHKHSEVSKKKISMAMRGENHWNYGKKYGKKLREKLRIAHLGYVMPKSQKEKISRAVKGKGYLKYWKGKRRSRKFKIQVSNALKGKYIGKLASGWKGGISFDPYNPEFNLSLKDKIRKRDNYRCRECRKKQDKLTRKLCIHHIDYNKKNSIENNLISLCLECHLKTNFNRKDWTNYFRDKI